MRTATLQRHLILLEFPDQPWPSDEQQQFPGCGPGDSGGRSEHPPLEDIVQVPMPERNCSPWPPLRNQMSQLYE